MLYHGAQGTVFLTVLNARCAVDMLDSSLASLGGEVYVAFYSRDMEQYYTDSTRLKDWSLPSLRGRRKKEHALFIAPSSPLKRGPREHLLGTCCK